MTCTCAGTAPGYPQHEDWCGQPEPEDEMSADRRTLSRADGCACGDTTEHGPHEYGGDDAMATALRWEQRANFLDASLTAALARVAELEDELWDKCVEDGHDHSRGRFAGGSGE